MPQAAQTIPSIKYPKGIDSIEYASFLEIERLQYKEGLSKAKGATETLLTSGLAGVLGAAGQAIGNAYNAPTTSIQNAIQAVQSQNRQLNTNRRGRTTISQPSIAEAIKNQQLDNLPDNLFDNATLEDGTKVTKEYLKGLYTSAKQNKYSSNEILKIALPNEMQYGYGADWNNTFKIGTLAQAFATTRGLGNTAGIAALGAGLGAGYQALQNNAATSQATGFFTSIATGAAQAINIFNQNSPLGITGKGAVNLVGLAGLAPNENAVNFFQSIQFREFDFTFEIFAPNNLEAKTAEKIIRFFKEGMHPSAPAGTGVLKFPDVYILTPKFVPVDKDGKAQSPKAHPLLPKSKSCAITNLKINTTPMNSIQTTYDGYFPLITINVTFKELTALTREDITDNITNGGGY